MKERVIIGLSSFILVIGIILAAPVSADNKIPVLIFKPQTAAVVSETSRNRIFDYLKALLDTENDLQLITAKAKPLPKPEKPKIVEKPKINPRIERAQKLLDKGKRYISKHRYEQAVRSLYSAVNLLKANLADLEDFDVFVQAKLMLSIAFKMADYQDEAASTLRSLLTLRPDLFLDKGMYPPKYMKFFNRLKMRFKRRPSGTITIKPSPLDAKVYCDGKLVGTGVVQLKDIPVGRHYLRIIAEGYKNRAIRVYTPAKGRTKKIVVRMKPAKGRKIAKSKAHKVDVSALINQLNILIKQGNFGPKLKSTAHELTTHYSAPYLITGYLTKADNAFHMTIFVYKQSNNTFYQLNTVVISDDMGNLSVSLLDQESAIKNFILGKGSAQAVVRKPAIYALAPPPPPPPVVKPAPKPVVAVAPAAPPKPATPPPAPKPDTTNEEAPLPMVSVTPTQPTVHITQTPAGGLPMQEETAIRPWYKKWWVWTIVGVVVVGAGVGTYLGVTSSHKAGGFNATVQWTPY